MDWIPQEFFDITLIKALITGIIIAFLINLTGVGGGIIIIPVLTSVFGLPVSIAIGTASIYSTITKVLTCGNHINRGNVHFKHCFSVLKITLPTVVISAIVVNYALKVSPQINEIVQEILTYLVFSIMILSCWLIYRQIKPVERTYLTKTKRWLACVIVGIIMGATGIGGGVLLIPLLLSINEDSMKQVVGNSILIALVLSAATAFIYSGGGQTDFNILAAMLIGSIIAVIPSGRLGQKLSNQTLSYLSITLILCSGILMLST